MESENAEVTYSQYRVHAAVRNISYSIIKIRFLWQSRYATRRRYTCLF